MPEDRAPGAFAILAAYTYTSGLRAPALISFIKDSLIYVVIIVAVIYIPSKLGGYGHIFDVARAHFATPKAKKAGGAFIPPPGGRMGYWTLALGSAFALFMYPHAIRECSRPRTETSSGATRRCFRLTASCWA